ncbi:hypothetical protein [Neobacillus niacini]|uniref:hypothetical protein n=1 Tax=Neobacillus niacini TaxID=86668 RepID=UPI00285F3F6B|nr:hypothetical protein [Neobacillus niacini]MDR6999554.1 hypothetical protein [Neobacillus niacini]
MMEMIQSFLTKVKECNHVRSLLNKEDCLLVHFICGQQNIEVILKNGECTLLHDPSESFIKCEIYGDEETVEQLLSGERKLRFLMQNGRLQVMASFRTLLLLEALFYLTKIDTKSLNII